jgi:hypothetical protein
MVAQELCVRGQARMMLQSSLQQLLPNLACSCSTCLASNITLIYVYREPSLLPLTQTQMGWHAHERTALPVLGADHEAEKLKGQEYHRGISSAIVKKRFDALQHKCIATLHRECASLRQVQRVITPFDND